MSSNSFIRLTLSLLVGLLISGGTAACAVPPSPLSEESQTTPSQATVLDVKFKIVIAPNELDAPVTTMAAHSELDAPLTITAAHSELDAPLRTLISHNELTGDPSIGRDYLTSKIH